MRPDETSILSSSWLYWIGVLWTLGFLGAATRLLRSSHAVRRLSKDAIAPDGMWHELVSQLRLKLGIAEPVRLLFSSRPISPMTWGIFRHVILLPAGAMQWNEARLRLVLAHELAHVMRSDGLLQVFAQFVCSVYWFNPAVWYAARRMRVERERACDDHVLNLGTNAADYAGHLLEIARGIRGNVAFSFASVSMAQPSQLETRLLSILNPRASRRALSPVAATILTAVIAAFTISIAAIGLTAAIPLPPEPPLPTVPEKMFAEISAPAITEPAPRPAPEVRPSPAERTRTGNAGTIPNGVVTPPQVPAFDRPSYTEEAPSDAIEGNDSNLDNAPVKLVLGVSPPTVISRVDPQYTEEARKERYTGTLVVEAVIAIDGSLKVGRVIRALDYGLTEKGIEALEQWKFNPGMRNGKPVAVQLNIEVNFNLR